MQIRLTLNNRTRQALLERLHQAYQGGNLRLIRRIHCLLYLADGKSCSTEDTPGASIRTAMPSSCWR
jgi:hypothetical protein